MPPRILPVTEPDPLVADGLRASIAVGRGPASNLAWTLAHSPFVCEGYRGLGRALFVHGTLPARLREVIALRIAWNCRSAYVFGNHVDIAQEAGIPEHRVDQLAQPRPTGLPEDEEILVDIVDELHHDDDLTESSWVRLRQRWSEPELTEIVVLTGFYRMASLFANTIRVELEAGLPGWPTPARRPEDRHRST